MNKDAIVPAIRALNPSSDKFLVCINMTSDIDDIIITTKILNNIFYV